MPRLTQDGTRIPSLFAAEPFEGFGPSRFRLADETSVGCRLVGRGAKLLRGVQEHAPFEPGVYGMLDPRGRIIYIGKAKQLRTRLLGYFREKSRDPKAGRILRQTRVLVWEQASDEFGALLRELELIQRFRPRFNVLGQPGLQRHHYVCIGKGPAAHAYVAKTPTGNEVGAFGPLVARPRSEDAVRRLNDWFRLRDCPQTVPMVFSDQAELFPIDRGPQCLRYEIGTCRGPCVGACSRKEYAAGVRGLKAFLEGRDRTLLPHLRDLMTAAAEEFQFERAMAVRDRLQSLEWLDNRLSLLRRARGQNSFVYPVTSEAGGDRWYLIHGGEVRAVVKPAPSGKVRRRTVATVRAVFSSIPKPGVLTGTVVDSVLLVAAWFRKHSGERDKLLTQAQALEMVTD